MCVYDFLKENDFAPFPRHHIQDFARQLFGSVACMFRHVKSSVLQVLITFVVLHDHRLIHTDLKPENILLVHNDYRVVNVPVPGKVCASIPTHAFSALTRRFSETERLNRSEYFNRLIFG